MGPLVRGAVVVLGVLMMLGGLVLIVGGPIDPFSGLWLVAMGGFLVIVIAIERNRYRSAAAEHANLPAGPGGGEPAALALDARFRPTGEKFIDPTTGVRMRVVVDPSNGERRYVAEG
jgi:hypothetical protein